MNTTVAKVDSIRFFTFDHVQKKIIGSQFNFDKSGILGTEQYTALMIAMAKHPNYELFPIAPAKEKQTYQGLTLKFMNAYIQAVGTEESKAQYNTYIKQKNHFATIKSWFLEEYKGFTSMKVAIDQALKDIFKDWKESVSGKSLHGISRLFSLYQQIEHGRKHRFWKRICLFVGVSPTPFPVLTLGKIFARNPSPLSAKGSADFR